jgi:hypothetical protein
MVGTERRSDDSWKKVTTIVNAVSTICRDRIEITEGSSVRLVTPVINCIRNSRGVMYMFRTDRPFLLLAAMACLLLAGCGSSPPLSDGDRVAAICDVADGALRTVHADQSVDGVTTDVAQIRSLNGSMLEANAIWWQVSQLADAWEGYVALHNDPELSDGGTAVAASLENLVRFCNR